MQSSLRMQCPQQQAGCLIRASRRQGVVCCLRQQQQRESAAPQHQSSQQQQQQQQSSLVTGRRAALAAALLPVVVTTTPPTAQASVSSDLLEGTGNLANIGSESVRLWATQLVDSIVNNDETGITDLDSLDGSTRKRRFGKLGRVWGGG